MTDKISDFFKDIKDRLSNPFISSFIITWLIFNWRVPVSLLWYSQAELVNIGHRSHFDFINKLYSFQWFIIWPTVSAFAYTFLFPFFRNEILVFNAWIKSKGSKRIFKASGEGKVPMSRYILLRENYNNQSKKLEDVINREGE